MRKTELVDLMNLADPFDLCRRPAGLHAFPYTTIEDVLVLDPPTLLVVNANNFPYGSGREPAFDNTEFMKIRLPFSLKTTTMIMITTTAATIAEEATTGKTTELDVVSSDKIGCL